jgi:uncharacterized protein
VVFHTFCLWIENNLSNRNLHDMMDAKRGDGMTKNQKIVVVSSLIIVVLLYLIEQVLDFNYGIKTVAKLIAMVSLPLIYIKYVKKEGIKEALNLRRLSFSQVSLGFGLGSIALIVVILSYIIFHNMIDPSAILDDLKSKNITVKTFIWIGIYITFFNSFLEEFFFRGYVFLNLEKETKKFAYLYSSLLFALYHIGIFLNWFNIYLILLSLLGLVIIGLVFDYLDTKSNNFLNSYIVHVLADVAVILIGLRLFEVI